MKKIVITSAMVVGSIMLGLFTAYVVFDVSTLFEINQITSLGYAKIYALTCIIALVFYKRDNIKSEDKSYEEKMSETLVKILDKALLNLFVWGLMYVMHFII